MMRPVTVEVPWRTPPAPTGFTFDPGSGLANWVDATPVDYSDPTTWHDPDPAISSNQEIGFRIERATVSGKDKGVFKEVTTGLATLGVVHQTTLPYSPYQYVAPTNMWRRAVTAAPPAVLRESCAT